MIRITIMKMTNRAIKESTTTAVMLPASVEACCASGGGVTPLYDGEIVVSIAATPLGDRGVDIAGAHPRTDFVLNDAVRVGVGQLALQTIANLDANLVVLHEDKQHRAVVVTAPPDLPMVGGFAGPGLQRNVAGRLTDPNDDLMPGRRLVGVKLVLERRARGARKHAGVIGDVVIRRRRYLEIRPRSPESPTRTRAARREAEQRIFTSLVPRPGRAKCSCSASPSRPTAC